MAIDNGRLIIDIDGDTTQLERALGRLDKIGTAALSALAAGFTAVGAGIASSIGVGARFEHQMSIVESISGSTADQMERLTAKAQEMGKTSAFSATQAGEAFQFMAQAGWNTEQMLGGIEGIMDLAAASGQDLASTSDIVTDALTAFGLAASDAGRFSDVLAKASARSNTDVGKMGYTFKYVAPLAGALKYSIEDTAVAIGLMANAGIKGEQAGTALRGIFTRLVKPTKDSEAAINALGLSITNVDGTMKPLSNVIEQMRKGFAGLTDEQKATYAAMLGGQEAMSGLLALVNASDQDFANLTKEIQNSAGAAKDMADIRLDNLVGQFTLLKSAMEGLGIVVYDAFSKPLTEGVKDAQKAISGLTDDLSGDAYEALSSLGVSLGSGFSDAVTVLVDNFDELVSGLELVVKNLDFLTLAFVGLMAKSKLTSGVLSAQALTYDRVKTAVTGLTAEERRREVLRAAARSAQAQDLQAATRELVAVRNLAQARVQEAQAAVVSAQAQQQHAVTRRQVAAAVIVERNAVIQLSAAQASALVATNNLRNSQALLRTTIQSTAASMTLLSGIAAGLRNVGSTLLAALGGPVGIAITGLVLGLSYLATRESEAEKAARELATSQQVLQQALSKTAGAADGATTSLTKMQLKQAELAAENVAETISKQWELLNTQLSDNIQLLVDIKDKNPWATVKGFEEHYQGVIELNEQYKNSKITTEQYNNKLVELIAELKKGDAYAQAFAQKLEGMITNKVFSNVTSLIDKLGTLTQRIFAAQKAASFVGPPEPEQEKEPEPIKTPAPTGGTVPRTTSGTKSRATQFDEEAAAAKRLEDAIKRVQMTDAAYQQWQISQEVNELTTKYPNLTAKVREWEQAQLQALRGEIVENIRSVVEELGKLSQQDSTPDLKVKKDIDEAWLKLQQLKVDLRNVDTSISQTGGILPTLDPELIRAMNAPTAKEAGAGFAEDMGTGIQDSWGSVGSGIGSALRQALEGEKDWGSAFAELGMNLIEGLVGGLWDTANSLLTDVLKSIGGYIVKSFSGFMGIASPSKVFADLGYWTMAGYAEGLTDSAKMAMKPLSDLKSSMSGAMSGVDMGSIKASLMPSTGLAMAGAGGFTGGVNVSIINKSSANIEQASTSVSYDNQGNMDITATIADAAVGKITQTGSRQEKAISRKFGMKNQPTRR